ncbi:aldo/keto reductase [Kaistia dalseonensis]|uniref:Diketogulonate reductase-like aldo/keto reductase n=1 Tax=Kaistia dalseonensis TaxID=410840 RepID=A0ABU0H141_9HYPH|nr:aldo/keto reductase [Kaistia dalseonensis]MCX5493470.1 aldo/keto reductase [Kaistia dalseonensis]MDQ0436029.1 diketogulonate reductase-like aldo/keto reductase [Kaistia dalseonensis]
MHTVTAHGASIPAIGLGTWMLNGQRCVEAVSAAIGAGYRHIDTAIGYSNETEVGEGIRAAGVPRDTLFVTTKIPPDQLGADAMLRAAEGSLARLKLDQVDLLLIHWPSQTLSAAETIRSLNAVKRRGLTRHIGVSNYTIRLLDEAWAATEEPIVANQCEHHPYLDQTRLRAATHRHGMAFVAYSPLGQAEALDEPVIKDIAAKLGCTPAQIILRWHMQNGSVAIPRSAHPARIRQNIDVFGFELSADDMAAIDALQSTGTRICDYSFSPEWDV